MGIRVEPKELRRRSEQAQLGFTTTDDIEGLEGIIGQDRALEALRMGLRIKDGKNRYNIYVSGDTGLGKTSAVSYFLRQASVDQPPSQDICYVHNFDAPQQPRYLLLPPGQGKELQQDMARCVEFLRRELPKVLESDEFKAQAREERERFTAQRDGLFRELDKQARELGFAVQRTPVGVNTVPLKPSGEPYSQEEYAELSDDEQKAILKRQEELQEEIREVFQRLGQLEEAWQESRRALTRKAAQFLVEPRFCQLLAKYAGFERVEVFLREVQADIVEHVEEFKPANKQAMPMPQMPTQDRFARYSVNVLVDRSQGNGAPVVVEDNATYTNLVGTVERRVQFGVVMTDFTQIRPGSLHRANGGYLVLSAANLLRSWMSWEALKIALRTGQIRIEDPAQMLGISSTEGLRPEPVPLDVKVIIIGAPWLYHLLHRFEDEFRKLFSVRADFETDMPWTQEAERKFGQFVRSRRDDDPDVLPFTAEGVGRLVEHAGELAADQRKLSVRFSELAGLVREASYWAAEQRAEAVEAAHVRLAIDKREERHGRIAERIREMIARGKLVVDLEGRQVGQVNGLAVADLGDHAFGRPARITASVYAGKDGVVDIEREAKLGGKIHTKGVLILKGYLGARFARQRPVSLSASLAFEQSYSMIDGDSASSAEIYAVLSALADVPLAQGIAVTGSVDQQGRLQPIGAVNEKIYGHFLVCRAQGLTGEQGVIVPATNVDGLMLPEEVVEAVEDGEFTVWACSTVEEGIEVLTGMPAGTVDAEGRYPEGSVFALAQARLAELTEAARATAEDKDVEDS